MVLLNYMILKIEMRNYDEHINTLIDISNSIKINERSILTGKNGAGKSLIRKLLSSSVAEQLGKDGTQSVVASTSQELRTGSNPEMGALAGAMRDVGWTPTSTETFSHIEGLLKLKDRYIVIDEPEIGMGEETVMALVDYLNEELPKSKNLGVCIITHNRHIINALNIDAFYNIEGMKKAEWLTRTLKTTNLKHLKDESMELMQAIQKRINKNQNNET